MTDILQKFKGKKLLIANRGEIAVRIIKSAKTLGLTTIQVYSEADKDSLAVRLADESYLIGAAPASKSYLNSQAILDIAVEHKVDAIHPGYGFFAENAKFAKAVLEAGIIFVGPDPKVIETMGNKAKAIEIAKSAGIQTIPGSINISTDLEKIKDTINKIGFPVLIKASYGGGGRGIRICNSYQEFEKLFQQASLEAKAAFGQGGLYIEKFIKNSRHIEVQILSDGKNCIHLFERECSLQRRRQKVWEETPSVCLSDKIRQDICLQAVRLAKQVGYKSAGTIEFLFDSETKNFYFIEMNTRIQVEHPITEMVTGVDIISEMIKIAFTNQLKLQQKDIKSQGHAIEVRINAEDPNNNFMPSPGKIHKLTIPKGDGVRFDGMIFENYDIPPYYDSLLGKLIILADTRDLALKKLELALANFKISGINTTLEMLRDLVKDKDVILADYNTLWLEEWMSDKLKTT